MDFRLHNNVGLILIYVGFILLLRQIALCLSLPILRAFIPFLFSQAVLFLNSPVQVDDRLAARFNLYGHAHVAVVS